MEQPAPFSKAPGCVLLLRKIITNILCILIASSVPTVSFTLSSSEESVPYSTGTQHVCKLRALLRISIYLSLFSDHFLLQLSRVLAAHSHPSETLGTGAAKEKEAQTALRGAGVVRAGAGFAGALVLGGTLGQSLASDFLQPLDGTKNAAVASACSWKIT